MEDKLMIEMNNKLFINSSVLTTNANYTQTFKLYPSSEVISSCGFIKNFEPIDVQLNIVDEHGVFKVYVTMKGEVELFSQSGKDLPHYDTLNLSDEFYIVPDDDEESDFVLLNNGNYDLLGVVLAMLYEYDYCYYS